MTRLSKKIITWLLGAIAFVAVSFGVVFTIPKTNVAKADDVAVTFNEALLEGDSDAKGVMQIRINTQGQTWETSHNDKLVSELPTVADYTTINGRTLTELQNASTSDTPIKITMQPAGSFSFIRVFIPLEVMKTSQVRAIGILDGWSLNNGTANYTSPTVNFLRVGDVMVTSDNYTANTKLTPADISIGDAQLVNPSNAAWGVDSYNVYIDIGQSFGEYDTMYGGYAYVRNAIYINGKSIEEWNAQMIAEDDRFNDPASYTRFPQNSADPSHKDYFVKPVGLWGTSTGFRLSIYQELVANLETVEVTIGAGCWLEGRFMVTERVSKTVLTQNVVDVTNKLVFLDNSHNAPADWGETKMYYINTNGEKCWTKSPSGGCLNECDPSGAGGGQIQMKYITFNGSTLWDINKNDNGSYGSTQGNIANGGQYAPVFVSMSAELGSSLKLTVPTAFTNGKAGHEEIVIKKGFNVKEGDTSYYVENDIVFTNNGTSWSKEVKGSEIETEVTGIVTKANRTDGGNNENFVIFQLSKNDYAGLNTEAIADISSLYGYIDIGGTTINSYAGEKFFNVWGIQNSVAIRFSNYTALQNVKYITIKAGAKFPAYATQSGGKLTYFVTTEDVTFYHDVPNDSWSTTQASQPEETIIETSVVGIKTDRDYMAIELSESDYADAVDQDDVVDWSSLDGYIKIGDEIKNITYAYFDGSGGEWHNSIVSMLAGAGKGDFFDNVDSITILAGAKFPSFNTQIYEEATTYYKTTEDITFYKDGAQWTTTLPIEEFDITNEIRFVHQAQQNAGTETYMFRTVNNYWEKEPLGGCLNEYDYLGQDPVGGQEQMAYIYFNGKSLYDINRAYNDAYGSEQGNIVSGGQYAPILVFMKTDGGKYSYIQLHVPALFDAEGDGWGAEGSTASDNHKSFELKKGFTVTENGATWTVTKDLKWINVNGDWLAESELVDASEVTIDNPRSGGEANELYKIDITSNAWNITCNSYDFMEAGLVQYRKLIFINGVSIYDINENTDDSAYVYSTWPMTGVNGAQFVQPVLIEKSSATTLTLWIHKTYLYSLDGDVTITLGAGYNAYTGGKVLAENVDYKLAKVNAYVNNGTETATYTMFANEKLTKPADPTKPMTATASYVFDNWYEVGTDTVFDFNTPIAEDIEIEARFIVTKLIETQIESATYHIGGDGNTDRWFYFTLTNHDYPTTVGTYKVDDEKMETVKAIGLLEKITIKGDILLGGLSVEEATLAQIFEKNGLGEAVYMNLWYEAANESKQQYLGTLAFRLPGVSSVTDVIVEAGALFPSYEYISGQTTMETYLMLSAKTEMCNSNEDGLMGVFLPVSETVVDIQMEAGAAVRITSNTETSGLRFQTNIAKKDLDMFVAAVAEGKYQAVSFGTLIVPKDYLMGGLFTHEWLNKNELTYLDIQSTATLDNLALWQKKDETVYSFFGSIVKLKESNYDRAFAGIGYIKLTDANGVVEYVYAPYDAVNGRSASFVANAAINDRSGTQTNNYDNYISENNNYSPYTKAENDFLAGYIKWTETSAVNAQQFELGTDEDSSVSITPTTQKLAGPYVELHYTTNVNVWGVFTYTDGTKTANEDFYLQAGTTHHKQFLDIFRSNAVGVGMNASNLSMTSITFTNAELQACTGKVNVIALYSQNKTIDMEKQEIYLTVKQADGSEMTVGAHLGLGGALTYLAKSGIYEGVTASGYRSGNVKLSTNPDDFVAERNTTLFGSKEKGYYGNATSSKAADGAVNLINNVDAGRQIQQSWYAQVGKKVDEYTYSEEEGHGYERAFCKTESALGKYWPYNPVQAGDVVSNPSQIVDYEINEAKGYIYVKTRAMDWAKGQGSDKLTNTIVGGSTTKSYMENYYRLKDDGTLTVNNSFVDWNGFTDMELCDWASTELPAVYPVHTLNYYVSNLDGDGSWKDGLEYKSGLEGWTKEETSCRQGLNKAYSKVEDWFAWANGGDGNAFGMGVYIPNVTTFVSGRSKTTTAVSENANRNAKTANTLSEKGLMSNMQPIQYTYQSAYVSNTSYTAPGIAYRMEAYKPIEYSYVICLGTINNIRSTFKAIKDKGTVTNAGNGYEKVGLDAWARSDKMWTW